MTGEAPRWRLLGPHYLNVPGTEWEYKQQDRSNPKKQVRHVFPVPMFLDPSDPSDHNYISGRGPDGAPIEGQIIVTQVVEGSPSRYPADIIFEGEPTPEMEPLNDAAEAITTTLRKKWERNPIDMIAGDFSQSLIRHFEEQMNGLVHSGIATPNVPVKGSLDEIATLKSQVQQLMEQNAAIQAQLLEKLDAEPGVSARRV